MLWVMSRKMLRKDDWNCYNVVSVGIVFPNWRLVPLSAFWIGFKTFLSLKSHSLRVLSTVNPYVPIITLSGNGKRGVCRVFILLNVMKRDQTFPIRITESFKKFTQGTYQIKITNPTSITKTLSYIILYTIPSLPFMYSQDPISCSRMLVYTNLEHSSENGTLITL